ncbi:hypothetical protein LI328DRAFT_74986 [Trichoderma asperelloides]|nr:hypothetical protein LI328DRAFT_74986 [Trichoderma asperelloides]
MMTILMERSTFFFGGERDIYRSELDYMKRGLALFFFFFFFQVEYLFGFRNDGLIFTSSFFLFFLFFFFFSSFFLLLLLFFNRYPYLSFV